MDYWGIIVGCVAIVVSTISLLWNRRQLKKKMSNDEKLESAKIVKQYVMGGKMNEYFSNDNRLLTGALYNLRNEVKVGFRYRQLGDNEILTVLYFLKKLARDWKNGTVLIYDIDTQIYQYLKNLNEQDKYKSNNDKEWDVVREMINTVLKDHS